MRTYAQKKETRNSDRKGIYATLGTTSVSSPASVYTSEEDLFLGGSVGYVATLSGVVSFTLGSVHVLKNPVVVLDQTSLNSRLVEIGRLSRGWDQFDAEVISARIIEKAKTLIPLIAEVATIAPKIVPLSGGTLQFEWRRNGKILELELESPDVIHFLKWQPRNAVKDEEILPITDRVAISELIEWFCTD